MKGEGPSQTAQGTAIMRAMHQTMDGEPKVLVDSVSARLVDPELLETVRAAFSQMPAAIAGRMRAVFVLRSRYAEDCVAEAACRGVRQCVILGAGLDTFAYRQPGWAARLKIYEVDFPSMQQWKREHLKAAEIAVPGNVIFVPVDFERVPLREGMAGAGFDFSVPAIFSQLGVSQYLTEDAFDLTLELVLSIPTSSEIVFSFVLRDEDLPAEEIPLAAMSSASASSSGEPWLTRFNPAQLVAKLQAMGFAKVVHLTPEEAEQRYFAGRRDGLTTYAMEQMIRAIV